MLEGLTAIGADSELSNQFGRDFRRSSVGVAGG